MTLELARNENQSNRMNESNTYSALKGPYPSNIFNLKKCIAFFFVICPQANIGSQAKVNNIKYLNCSMFSIVQRANC